MDHSRPVDRDRIGSSPALVAQSVAASSPFAPAGSTQQPPSDARFPDARPNFLHLPLGTTETALRVPVMRLPARRTQVTLFPRAVAPNPPMSLMPTWAVAIRFFLIRTSCITLRRLWFSPPRSRTPPAVCLSVSPATGLPFPVVIRFASIETPVIRLPVAGGPL